MICAIAELLDFDFMCQEMKPPKHNVTIVGENNWLEPIRSYSHTFTFTERIQKVI